MASALAAAGTPDVLWQHPRPETTEMAKFKHDLEREKGVKLAVCS
jgi:hypothetical protein